MKAEDVLLDDEAKVEYVFFDNLNEYVKKHNPNNEKLDRMQQINLLRNFLIENRR